MNRSILVSSTNQDANSFQVKLPQNIVVQPNSEIGLVRGVVQQSFSHQFDSSNSTFTILIGQYNMANTASVATSAVDFLPPQKMELKSGKWYLKGNTGDTAGDSTQFGFGTPSILTNLVDSLNEQNRYYFWQFGGKWTSADKFSIFPYICDHHPQGVNWSSAILNTEGADLVITTTAFGAAKGFNTITTNAVAGGYLAVSETTPLCYSYNALPVGAAAKPQLWAEYTLPNLGAAINPVSVFAGLIMAQQEDYKKTQSYQAQKDWIGVPLDSQGSPELLDSTKYINKMIFSWELIDFNIFFIRREINENGEAGEVIEKIDSGVDYDGTAQRLIEYRPQIRSNGAGKTISELLARVDGVTIATYNLTSLEHKYDWKHAICQDTDFDIQFTGVDKSTYIFNKYTDTLGNMDQPTALPAGIGNINIGLSMEPNLYGEQMIIGPDTTVNAEFAHFTKDNNCRMLTSATKKTYYFINGNTSDFAAPTAINTNIGGADGAAFHVCVDNLPIMNLNCNGSSGLLTQRIYSHYDDSNSETEIIEPDNIIYHKLHNKQPFMLDHLRIRITDNDNRTYQALINTTLLNFHIRENPHRVYQDIDKMMRGLSQIMENKDTTEENFILANNVF